MLFVNQITDWCRGNIFDIFDKHDFWPKKCPAGKRHFASQNAFLTPQKRPCGNVSWTSKIDFPDQKRILSQTRRQVRPRSSRRIHSNPTDVLYPIKPSTIIEIMKLFPSWRRVPPLRANPHVSAIPEALVASLALLGALRTGL